ncbi:MAG: L,D-transpeptidase family protein [Candidatus Binatia bacterium]
MVEPVSMEIARRLAVPGEAGPIIAAHELRAFELVRRFYDERTFAPVWTDPNGPRPYVMQLVETVRASGREGLDPADYHATTLTRLLSDLGQGSSRGPRAGAAERATIELLATDAYFTYAIHALVGRHDDGLRENELAANGLEDPVAYLESAVRSHGVFASLAKLLPGTQSYRQLAQALAVYRRVDSEQSWLEVPPGRSMQLGNRDVRVPILRARLAAEPSAARVVEHSNFPQWFDGQLDLVVRDFQRRHGLKPDGVVGPGTLAALNTSAARRAQQIALNMERWRRLPRDLGERHIFVNIPGAELDLVSDGIADIHMRVVVGSVRWQTPILSSEITHFVVNPFWNVPRSIAVRTLLPNIQTDDEYLSSKGFRVYESQIPSDELDIETITWEDLGPGNFPYRLRQDPGPKNALGRMKFVFPNRFDVYLHDTPVRGAFVDSVRTRSHGCVRVEKPLELAQWLIGGVEGWSRTRLLQAIAGSGRSTVRLDSNVPVHLAYLTAWIDDTGAVHFRRDFYGRDRRLARTLSGI